MSDITTRAGKGEPLTHNEVDANFTNLNADKYQAGDNPSFGNITAAGTVDGRDVSADGSKLDGIEAGADVTDTANVTAAGALMDSEVTNLAAVKAFDPADYVDQTSATGSAELPAGTTAQRDGTPSAGYLRFNSTDGAFEGYDGSEWGALGGAIGVDQTWQDVTASRSAGTSYQNTTGKPIMVALESTSATAGTFEVSSDGTSWQRLGIIIANSTDIRQGAWIVPNNWYYRLTSGTATWDELR